MRYAFYFTTTANARGVFLFFLWNLKAQGLVFYHVFSDFISFGPKLQVYNFIYMALYCLQAGLMLQLFGLRCIFFFFTQLNKRRIFFLRRLVWLSSLNVYELCFLFRKKIKFVFWIHLFQRFFFSIWIFFHNHSRITRLQGKGEGISLTPHYQFPPLHRHLDISWAITAESSLLYIGSSRTRTRNLWFPSTKH